MEILHGNKYIQIVMNSLECPKKDNLADSPSARTPFPKAFFFFALIDGQTDLDSHGARTDRRRLRVEAAVEAVFCSRSSFPTVQRFVSCLPAIHAILAEWGIADRAGLFDSQVLGNQTGIQPVSPHFRFPESWSVMPTVSCPASAWATLMITLAPCLCQHDRP